MRFQKRIKVFPGVRLNLSKRGVSTTIGVRGASVTLGKRGAYANVGIPGTGISHRQKLGGSKRTSGASGRSAAGGRSTSGSNAVEVVYEAPAEVIASADVEQVTSEGLVSLRQTLQEVYQEREALTAERARAQAMNTLSLVLLGVSYVFIVGFFVGWFKAFRNAQREKLDAVNEGLEACHLNISLEMDPELSGSWKRLDAAFHELKSCHRIWDVTTSREIDRVAKRSAAGAEVSRTPTRLDTGEIPNVVSDRQALRFENVNGPDLYLFPGLLVLLPPEGLPGIVDIREVDFKFSEVRFQESGPIPGDSVVIDHVWAKTNKNGTRDKRFKDNYQIPVAQYGEIHVKSPGGVNEVFCFSDCGKAAAFAASMDRYKSYFS
ncbi:DUF4236 domain-containing protein [Lujinxingia vulgaris]|uniref:DUF4236 domain-containing protein n=1 Tax=Lujinxingia vulgaris TaxID=2600176 RepID=A0A5C6XBL4_9DELT|nr:DUF4236 domain-containing protein [Lujinxingia vulgaris]TXD39296.1 DUF4236 domain-containing protein [Lujinxingia vulgaris]